MLPTYLEHLENLGGLLDKINYQFVLTLSNFFKTLSTRLECLSLSIKSIGNTICFSLEFSGESSVM